MTASPMLAGARPITLAAARSLADALDGAARQAIELGEAIRVAGEVLVVPDVLLVECIANGHRITPTPAVEWPDDGGELEGRRCLVYRLA